MREARGSGFRHRIAPGLWTALLAGAAFVTPATAAWSGTASPDATAGGKAAPVAVKGGATAATGGATTPEALWQRLGLPRYQQPAAYSQDLVVSAEGKTYTMKRAVEGPRVRTDMTMDGQNMIMIETGDERGTFYTLVPDRKQAVKQSRASMDEMMGGRMSTMEAKSAGESGEAPAPEMKAEDLGDDTVQGIAARKLRLISSDGDVLAWFDKASGRPLRMQGGVDGKVSTIEWRNYAEGPQSAKLFEVPKGYKLEDMDEMAAQMRKMKGMGGMARGMMSGMAQGMGQSMGSQLGSAFGGALGGPLGAAAGQYIGGRLGSAIGKKAGDVVTP